jgi:hypothetical protein
MKYNRSSDIDRLKHIDQPWTLSSAELLRRILAFGPVRVRIGDELVWISGLGPVSAAETRGHRTVRLSDGVWRLKQSDCRAHRLSRIKRALVRGRSIGALA